MKKKMKNNNKKKLSQLVRIYLSLSLFLKPSCLGYSAGDECSGVHIYARTHTLPLYNKTALEALAGSLYPLPRVKHPAFSLHTRTYTHASVYYTGKVAMKMDKHRDGALKGMLLSSSSSSIAPPRDKTARDSLWCKCLQSREIMKEGKIGLAV